MTSLRASLPPPGSATWSSSRAQPGADDPVSLELRVRHVVIREVVKRALPKPHTLYKVDVMTQAEQWCVFRRYSEFEALHYKMCRKHSIRKDALPGKKFLGNLAPDLIEKRRESLERYLQRLISGDEEVVFSPTLLEFLEVEDHNVIGVTAQLTKHLGLYGERILGGEVPFHLTATQCRCIAQRLLLPFNYGSDGTSPTPGTQTDLSHLYDFVYQLEHLCIHPRRDPLVALSDAAIEVTEADVSCWRSVRKLEINHSVFAHIKGLDALQEGMTHLRLRYARINQMRSALQDAVIKRRVAPQAKAEVEAWRQIALTSFVEDRPTIQPWVKLRHLDLSNNDIDEIDTNCLELIPFIEHLDLHNNRISSLQPWLASGLILRSLVSLDLSGNQILTLKADKDHLDDIARKPSFSTRDASSVMSRKGNTPDAAQVDPSWVVSGRPKPASEGSASTTSAASNDSALTKSIPSPHNMPPPSYDSYHLISTNHPKAGLDELQRVRMQKWSSQQGQQSQTGQPRGGKLPDVPNTVDERVATAAMPKEDSVAAPTRAAAAATAASATGAQQSRASEDGTQKQFLTPLASILCSVTTLNLARNRIRTLKGLERMTCLLELDVSDNRIAKYQDISPLVTLSKLKSLSIHGNPVVSKKHYQVEIAARIAPPTQAVTIDGKQPSEKQIRDMQSQLSS